MRFQPLSFGTKTTTITVFSDDPTGPHTIQLTGHAPAGKIAVTGFAYFGGVKCGRRAFRTIAVCNVGDCKLHITKAAFEHENRHWHLVHNPFPATLHPGSCLDVVIRYKATQTEPHPCEVLIHSDDPLRPVAEVHAIAWTRCCCKKCCNESACEEHHQECCEDHRRECCDDLDGERCEEKHEEHSEAKHDERREETSHGRHRHQHWHDEDNEDEV